MMFTNQEKNIKIYVVCPAAHVNAAGSLYTGYTTTAGGLS